MEKETKGKANTVQIQYYQSPMRDIDTRFFREQALYV